MPVQETSSYVCPLCSGKTLVVDSRPTDKLGFRAVRRRRCCQQCAHRFGTIEINAAELDRIEAVLHGLSKRVRIGISRVMNEVLADLDGTAVAPKPLDAVPR